MTITDEQSERINTCMEIVSNAVEEHFTNGRKEAVEKMLEAVGDRYFSMPASAREDFHSAYPGGLVYHTIHVTKAMLSIRSALGLSDEEVPIQSVYMVGLFHDLGKIGDFKGNQFYTPVTDDWKRKKGIMYDYNDELIDGLSHSQRSVRLLAQYGVDLTDSEHLAILSHDGLYIDQNKSREMMYTTDKLTRIAQFADSYTCFCDHK
jgi:hypothetical protein